MHARKSRQRAALTEAARRSDGTGIGMNGRFGA